MNEALAFLKDRFVLAREATVSVEDGGFVLGTTVAEQLRTFGGRLFRLDEHLTRLFHSLEVVGVESPLSRAQIAAVAEQLVAHNHRLLDSGDDLGLSIFVTPGPYATFGPSDAGPLLGMHTYPLPFHLWAEKYTTGQRLVIPQVEQVSRNCWPPQLKCRSRMHYHLADREARGRDPEARALLVNARGFVTEASTANVVLVRGEQLVTPRRIDVLPGISLDVVAQLAAELNLSLAEDDLEPAIVVSSDEVLLTSTPNCLLPVASLDGEPIGEGRPGPVYQQIIDRWSAVVGVDIAAQSRRYASRS